jgi:hypothetical protein
MMKVEYTIVIEVDEIKHEGDFDVEVVGMTLARNGAEGTDTKTKRVEVKSCKARVTYEQEIRV